MLKALHFLLQFKKCSAFYIGETGQMLFKSVNGDRSACMVVNSNLVVPIPDQILSAPLPD
jgi:hypothetical protein